MGFLSMNDHEQPDLTLPPEVEEIIAHADYLISINNGLQSADTQRVYVEGLSQMERGYVIACLLGEIQRLNRELGN